MSYKFYEVTEETLQWITTFQSNTEFYKYPRLAAKWIGYYYSGRPIIKTGLQFTLGSHEIRPIHFATSLRQGIHRYQIGSKQIFFRPLFSIPLLRLPLWHILLNGIAHPPTQPYDFLSCPWLLCDAAEKARYQFIYAV